MRCLGIVSNQFKSNFQIMDIAGTTHLLVFLQFVLAVFGDISHFILPDLRYLQPPPPQLPPNVPFIFELPVSPQPPIISTTHFTLPDIVENRQYKEPQQGNFIPINHYLPPSLDNEKPLPVQNDQVPTSEYLPPKREELPRPIVVFDELDNQSYEYKKPFSVGNQFDEEPAQQFPSPILPPATGVAPQPSTTEEPLNGYHYDAPGGSQVRLHVKEMRCLDYPKGFFRATIQVESFLGAIPTIENDFYDNRCGPKLIRNFLLVDIAGDEFKKCGVQRCGKELCVRLRFPSVRGMRTSGDSIVSLRCQIQNRVAVKTHAIKMGVSNEIQARNNGVYAHGGNQNEFRTFIELLRKTPNGYTKILQPNDLVQLGEELLLRAHVGTGDGWNHTKLTDVSLQRISQTGDITRSVNLITTQGCVNPSMRTVCSQSPMFDPPLGQRMLFKAVMFQEMRSGEEMVLSMRITGCLEKSDCHISSQECTGDVAKRQRRNAHNNSTEFSEISKISFRVEVPGEVKGIENQNSNGTFYSPLTPKINAETVNVWVTSVVLLFVGMLGVLGVLVFVLIKCSKPY